MTYLNNKNVSFFVNGKKVKVQNNFNRNELPYASTYLYNDIVDLGEDLEIKYYATDYKQLDNFDITSNFSAYIEIGLNQDVLYSTTVSAISGDNVYNLPTSNLSAGEYWYSIQIENTNKIKSGKTTHFFMIYDKALHELELENNTYIVSDEDLETYNINKNGEYGEYILVSIPSENLADPYSYLVSYASNFVVESGKYKCFLSDTNGDGFPNYKQTNWLQYTEGDYISYVKYASDYDKELVEAEALLTTRGIRNLINDKINQGYKNIILPQGYYRTSTQDVIEIIGNNVVVDFNNSTIKSNSLNIDTVNGLRVVNICGNNSKIINANIKGCLFETNYSDFITAEDPKASKVYEIGHGINICNFSKFSGFENCTVKDITGYGAIYDKARYSTHPMGKVDKNNYCGYITLSNKNLWILGDIDEFGKVITCNDRMLYNTFIDITFHSSFPYICIGKYMGYGGFLGGGHYVTCSMYDENYNYLGNELVMQFRHFWLKPNTKYIKIVALTNVYERVSGTTTYPLNQLTISSDAIAKNCYLKNVTIDNVRCVGLTPYGKDCYIENSSIIRSGFAQAHQLVDAEDSWERLHDYTFKDCVINQGISSSYLLLCSGINVMIDGGHVDFSQYGRAKDTKIINSTVRYLDFGNDDSFITGYPVIKYNNFDNPNIYNSFTGTLGSFTYKSSSNYIKKQVVIDETNNFIGCAWGTTKNNDILFKGLKIDFTGRVPGSNGTLMADYKDCEFNNLIGRVANIKATLCVFNNCSLDIRNIFNGVSYTNKFTNCIFNNCTIVNNSDLSNEELFVNCTFK